MNSETKNCQNCKNSFTIEPDDFLFYQKINVPPPTFCPDCRLQRRLVWMKGLDLFKRKCDLCGEMKISMYHPNAPYTVYCTKCWWSDKWDFNEYATDYNPQKTFFAQWNELLHKVPLLGISIDAFSGDNSPFTNHVSNAKDCFMIYYCNNAEYCGSDYLMTRVRNVYDSAGIMDVENCYDSSHLYKSYNIVGSTGNNRSCNDCFFLRDCEGCHDCFGAVNLKNGAYVFMGQQLTKEEYQEKLKNINLGSYEQYIFWKGKAVEYFKSNYPKPAWETLSQNVSGSYVFHSKNVHNSYDVCDSEDSKYMMLIKNGKVKDCYDYTDWGENAERLYECITVGGNVSNVLFTHESGYNIHNVEYSKLTGWGSSYNFGCIGIRKGEYYILNKKYNKEDYVKLREQIIKDMNKNPYISTQGHVYKYGEFFPLEFSPHSYNDSFASRFFPLDKEEVVAKGLKWQDIEEREYTITLQNADIPDDIKSVDESILNEIIGCGNCIRGFKVIPQELQFLQKHNLPLPRRCPFCRVWEKVDVWIQNMTLNDRVCQICGVEFKTHYNKERAPKIICKECYKKEYL